MQAQIFIDADNVSPEVGFKVLEKFSEDYSIERVDIIGRFEYMSEKYRKAKPPCRVQNCFFGKNAGDTWLCVEIAKSIYENPATEIFIIVSNDKDFLPAIKLVVDKKKYVLFVSDSAGHRKLMRILREVRVDLNFVRLIDYCYGLSSREGDPFVISPRTKKLDNFYLKLSTDGAGFLRRYEEKIRFIFVAQGAGFAEVPFVPGMTSDRFKQILRDLKIISRKMTGVQAAHRNLLKVLNNRIYFYREDELENSNLDKISKFPNLSDYMRQYFLESADLVTTIFIKHAGQIFEIPFVNGMEFSIFSRNLHELKFIGKHSDVKKIIVTSFLKIENNHVYLLDEEELPQTLDKEKISEKFFAAHKNKVKNIFVKHNGQIFEVPFVNGMAVSMFATSLRESNIIGKNAGIQKIIANSLLSTRNNSVYLLGEEELPPPAQEETVAEKFFSEHKGEVKNIFVKRGEKLYEVPFVNGMRQGIFFCVLKNRGIVGKISEVPPIIRDSFLDLIDGQVYFQSEEKLFDSLQIDFGS